MGGPGGLDIHWTWGMGTGGQGDTATDHGNPL